MPTDPTPTPRPLRTLPRRLTPGDTIRFVAPSRPPRMENVGVAAEALRRRGYCVSVPHDLAERTGYLAGDDETRAAEITAAFACPDVDAVFPLTGGFGATRMLERIEYDVIRANPKIFVGFSDITALHAAIGRRAGLVTFHSPNLQWQVGSPEGLHPFAEQWFWRALEGPPAGDNTGGNTDGYTLDVAGHQAAPIQDEPAVEVQTLVGGTAEGPIVGGNLALVAALMGTPDELDTAGRILFLEDVGEPTYRIDRMLAQLRAGGKLEDLAGVVLGRFTGGEPDDTDGRTVQDTLREYFGSAPYPVLLNFPAGHVPDNATLPLGLPIRLDADRQRLTLLREPTVA
jgi:muramoyltetrapeptide carboxypeptidase